MKDKLFIAAFCIVAIIWITAIGIPAMQDNTDLVKHNIGWAVSGTAIVIIVSSWW